MRDRQEESALPLFAAGQRIGELVHGAGDVRHLGGPGDGHPHVPPAGAQEAGGDRGPAQRPRQQLPDHQPDDHGHRDPGQQGDGEVAPDETAAERAGLGGADQREPADGRGPGLDQVAHPRRRRLRGHRLPVEHPPHVRLFEHGREDPGVAGPARRHDHHGDALAGEHVDDPAHPGAGPQPAAGLGELRGHHVRLLGEDLLRDRPGGDRHQPHGDQPGGTHGHDRHQQARRGDTDGERRPTTPTPGGRRPGQGDRRRGSGCRPRTGRRRPRRERRASRRPGRRRAHRRRAAHDVARSRREQRRRARRRPGRWHPPRRPRGARHDDSAA